MTQVVIRVLKNEETVRLQSTLIVRMPASVMFLYLKISEKVREKLSR